MRWWGKTAKISIDIRDQSVPQQWLLEPDRLPSEEQHAVLKGPEESGSLTADEVKMTNSDIDSLLEAYLARKWTVREVTTAFLKKAVTMNQLTNFTTEFLTQEALAQADTLDAHLATTNTLKGPLHGIPTSLTEPIPLANHISHSGIVSRIAKPPPPTESAPLVHHLLNAGAVIHLRTNVNQALIGLGCENNILGRTLNPLDRRLSPGGPSGGEGVSVGSGCAVLGVGVGVGVPAAFGGCYGFKPTAGRIPPEWAVAAEDNARNAAGPLARSVDGLQAWLQAVLEHGPAPAPWRSNLNLNRGDFTVGVMWDDGILKPHPPVRRALQTAAYMLRAAGIKVVEWEAYDHDRGHTLLGPLFFPDPAVVRHLEELDRSGEPQLPSVLHALEEMDRFLGKSVVAGAGLVEDPHQTLAAQEDRECYQREHDALMAERGVDFILGPAYVGAGALHDDPGYSHYTSIWDVLDMPAVVLPSGLRCDKVVDVRDETYVPKSDIEEAWAPYDPELFDGLPIALQLAGQRAKDEEVLTAAGVLDQILKAGKGS